jgi:hypothetical protein
VSLLESSNLWDPESCYLATNAQFYKPFEYWAFGAGIALRNMVNSGRSLGDNRVDWRTVALALSAAAAKGGAARDAIIIAADSAPAAGAARSLVGDLLAAARAAGKSACLIGAPAPSPPPPPPPGAAPACVIALPAAAGGDVAAVSLSTDGCVAAGAAAAFSAAAAHAFCPALYALAASDVETLLSAEGAAAVAAAGSRAPASPYEEIVVPLESALGVLASKGAASARGRLCARAPFA